LSERFANDTSGDGSCAEAVGNAVEAATKQKWNIVSYERPRLGCYIGEQMEIECGEDWEGRIEHNGWTFFGYRNTGSTKIPEQEIEEFVQMKFGEPTSAI
jgi:hypothetical protein